MREAVALSCPVVRGEGHDPKPVSVTAGCDETGRTRLMHASVSAPMRQGQREFE